jgi:hypothetical protein
MKTFFLVVLNFAAVSCSQIDAPTFVVDDIKVYDEVGISPADISNAFNVTMDEFEAAGYNTKQLRGYAAQHLLLHVTKDFVKCAASKNGLCYGLFQPGYRIDVYANDTCIGKTALSHELIHWALYWSELDMDGGHTNSLYYGAGGIMSRVNAKLVASCDLKGKGNQ